MAHGDKLSSKTIAINGRFLSQPVTGVQRYAHELLRELDNLLASQPAASQPVEVLAPPNIHHPPAYKSLLVRKVGRLTGHAWEQLELPFHCRGKLLFSPCGGPPLLHNCHVVTIHDAAEFATPHAYSAAYGIWYRWLHKRIAGAAHRVIAVSEFSKLEIVRWCNIPPAKISVTHLGSDHLAAIQPDASILSRHHLAKGSYVLAVSSHNANKNFQGVVRAINFYPGNPPPIVIAGSMNSQVFGDSGHLPPSVIQIGRVSDAQLRALYESAGCFVFPSFYEGFGLPPLEAMASGCPVIAANIPVLRETCGPAAVFCNPADPSDIANQIAQVMTNSNTRSNLIEQGLAHTAGFRWSVTAQRTWEILQEIASSS